ncbi:MAG: hypothetical protein HY782_05490 [Chloroflexi bacterium]|nr:hypothetical protein [Chloroflexota bacterium]
MSHKTVFIAVFILLGTLSFAAAADAQGPKPGGTSRAPRAAVGNAFTYQGKLNDGGNPANGAYDFQFQLFDDPSPSFGFQKGNTVTANDAAVTNGLFTESLDFGTDVFNGDARWLQIFVRPGASTGAYTTLTPRQALTPAPYAFALPGLYTQQNATSPNIIGGYNGNVISNTVVGGTIGGGGESGYPNRVWESWATVGGGRSNTASGARATVAGGQYNTAGGSRSTIAGGQYNNVTGDYSAVGGGYTNTVSSDYATIGGGEGNNASGDYAVIPGGSSNSATMSYTLAAGRRAKANHQGAFVWGDSTDADFASSANNQFLIRANGGVGVGANSPAAMVHVSSSGGDSMPQMRLSTTSGDYVRLRLTNDNVSVANGYNNRWDVGAISTTFTIYSGKANQNVMTLTPGGATNYLAMGNGATLSAGGTWTNASDRNIHRIASSIIANSKTPK